MGVATTIGEDGPFDGLCSGFVVTLIGKYFIFIFCECFEMQFVFQQMQAFLYTAMVHYICSYNYDFEVFLLPLNPELQLRSKFLERAQIWDFWGQLVQTESHFKLVLLKCPHSIES